MGRIRYHKHKDLIVGNRYWVYTQDESGHWCSKFRLPLVFVGHIDGSRRPWFTFGPDVDSYNNHFNYVAVPLKDHKFVD